jgi:hypothetical protein
MQEYNNTILNLIQEKECTVCETVKPKTEYGKKTGKCKECTSLQAKVKRMDRGKNVRKSDLFCLMPNFGFCPSCEQILHQELMNKRSCKDCKAKADKRSKENTKERNSSKVIDYKSITRRCCTCETEKSGIEFSKNISDVMGIAKECKECKKKFDKIYRQNNKEKILTVKRNCYSKRKDHYDQKSKDWALANPEKRKKIFSDFWKRKRSTPNGSVECRWTFAIRTCFKRNGGKVASRNWKSSLGYTPKDLCDHLEGLFEPGMNWEKFLNGEIHIDHIIPKSSFFYTSEEDLEFKECWALKNLKPIWNYNNWAKNDLMSNGSRGRYLRKEKITNISEPDDISAYGEICRITDEDTFS